MSAHHSPIPSTATSGPIFKGRDDSGASVQLLNIAPIRERLGPRWGQNSELVHTLLVNAIAKVQGAGDSWCQVNELSYLLTFRAASPTAASLSCTAIARDIFTHLFGEQYDEVSLQHLLATVPKDSFAAFVSQAILEHSVGETFSQVDVGDPPKREATTPTDPAAVQNASLDVIETAHAFAQELGLTLGFCPSWHLHKRSSSSLHFVALGQGGMPSRVHGTTSPFGLPEPERCALEIAMLKAAVAYDARLRAAGRVCAIGVGANYATLSGSTSRNHYLAELSRLRMPSEVPLVIKIEQVPEGAPLNRIAEFTAMMRGPGILVAVEFQNVVTMPKLDTPIQAIGFGGGLPSACALETAAQIAKKMVQCTQAQHAFAYLDRLDSVQLVRAAHLAGVKFGTGAALGNHVFSGLEAVPQIPIAGTPNW